MALTLRRGVPLLLAFALLGACGEDGRAQKDAAADSTPALPSPLLARAKGAATAPITVYELSDFQCPYCRMHALATFPELERDYVATGKVRWVFINFPLTEIHPNAVPAAEVALCAGRQDKFWPVHDILFRTQKTWGPLKEPGEFLMTVADSVGLDRERFAACLKSGETQGEIRADAQGAYQAGAQSTPTFYIEGGLLVGAQPAPVFRQILDSIYTAKTAK